MPKYNTQILTLSLTGCRPIELQKGILWKVESSKLVTTIIGAKISQYAGQEIRALTFPVIGELAEAMNKLVIENGGELFVSVSSTVNLTTAIRSAAKRAFPKFKKSVTAYSFRHQAAADWKAAVNNSDNPEQNLTEVSGMLGHATSQMKGRYGHSSQYRGSLVPEKVEFSRQVKVTNKSSYKKLSSISAKPQ